MARYSMNRFLSNETMLFFKEFQFDAKQAGNSCDTMFVSCLDKLISPGVRGNFRGSEVWATVIF